MVKFNLILSLVFLIGSLFTLSLVSAIDCSSVGCEFNGICYGFYEIINDSGIVKYCDIEVNWSLQKDSNAVCNNDFECVSSNCLSGHCLNLSNLLVDYTELYTNLSKFAAGPCSTQPGCLNISNYTNAHNNSQLCYDSQLGYTCFECNEDYEWNSSQNKCVLAPCTASPGCLDETSIENGHTLNRNCSINTLCFICNSGYSWNSSSSECYKRSSSSPDFDILSTQAILSSSLVNGFSGFLKEKWRFKIYLVGDYHYVLVTNILTSSVLLEVSSTTQKATMVVGQEKKFDVNGDNIYDLKIKINSLVSDRVYLTLYSIAEPITNQALVNNPSDQNNNPVNLKPSDNSNTDSIKIIVISVIVVVISILIIVLVILLTRKPQGVPVKNNSFRY